jgi:hypothetical protein
MKKINLIKIECSFCDEKLELFLSINPSIIILNCPKCWAPLLYTNEEVRILTELEMRKIPVSNKQKSIKNIIDKTFPSECKDKPKQFTHDNPTYRKNRSFTKNNYQNSPSMPTTRTCSRRTISKDDIIDLRIALAQCNDIKQLLEKI